MELNWFYYSDTNAAPGEINTLLKERNENLVQIHQLEELQRILKRSSHPVLFLKTHTIYNIYELCQKISTRFPHVYIVLMVPDNLENLKKAMLVGASNIIRQSAEEEEWNEIITQAQRYMQHRQNQDGTADFHLPKENSRVISVCSTKGGAGRTSLAVNLAAAFVKKKQKVAIIDANLQFGEMAVYLDLKPKQSIYEWVKEGYGRKTASVEDYMVNHQSGITLLAAPPRPEFFEIIKEEHLAVAIDDLKKIYDVVIIDTPPTISEIMLQCLTASDEILLLTSRDLPALRSSKLFIDTLETLKLKYRVKIILNKDNKKKIIDPKKAEEILQLPIFTTFPEQESMVSLSINEGIPFLLKNPRTPLAKGILSLAGLLKPLEEEETPKKVTRKLLVRK